MEKTKSDTLDLLEYLQDIVDNAQKVPMTGKSMIDKREVLEIIDDIINGLPDEIKTAQWVVSEKDRILSEAKKEYENVKLETKELMRQNVENHDYVREAKIRAQEIIAGAKREAKAIRVGSRDYADEILSDLDRELEKKKIELIEALQESFTKVAQDIDGTLEGASGTVRENIRELRTMK
ncbi:MAG: ATPase [Clostridium sp.]|uniref:ATPase n=1 Tax=Clostridium TaxID=1485 RepID=UPI0018839BDE|nr:MULTISPECIES: ATPase [Clostridium]MCR6515361.1 ATPase [Clostridium sp. LY3-2]